MTRKANQKPALIAYYRVSTAEQGSSSLGLDAQRQAVHSYAQINDLNIFAEFEEVLSTRKERPEFEAALLMCQQFGHMLTVARLDRLSRDLHTITSLQAAKVEFLAVDNPGASKLMIQILGAIAENERDMISERTKAALARAKANGKRLGAPDPAANIHAVHISRAEEAEAFREQHRNQVQEMRRHGMTFQQIADHFTSAGIPTPAGSKVWNPNHVSRILQRPTSLLAIGQVEPPTANEDTLPLFPASAS